MTTTCSYCDYVGVPSEIIKHSVAEHSNHPSFFLSCDVCGATYKKYESFRKHIQRKHPKADTSSGVPAAFQGSITEIHDISGSVSHFENAERLESQLMQQSASYVLKLKSVYGLPQSCIDDIMHNTKLITETATAVTRERLLGEIEQDTTMKSILDEKVMDWNSVGTVDVFTGIESNWMQQKYFREQFGLIEPVEIKMGERQLIKHKSGTVECVSAFGYCVPFLTSLQQLLQIEDVAACICGDGQSTGPTHDVMVDFHDGYYCKTHAVFGNDSNIRILSYFDDVEVVNPIGVHTKKHKISLFYWTLLNIPPKHRSKLSCIQLLAVAKERDCKEFGLSLLLNDFIAGINRLYNDGVTVLSSGGQEVTLRGGLVAFSADTLAASVIGGFKEGVGFAHKICRTCEITSEQSPMRLCHDECILREYNEHVRRCSRLQSPLTDKGRKYWSRVYGINKQSVLLGVEDFDVTSCLIHDPMHLLFEGVTPMEMKLLLAYAVRESSYFSLADLNCFLSAISESMPADCRPNRIEHNQIFGKDLLRQTAHQMWYLAHMLPLAVGSLVPCGDDRWMNFLRILHIQMLCTSPVATLCTVRSLEIVIAKHNSMFQVLYPDASYIPKMHYLIHLPNQILQFGPARNHWCMRMEAKNGFFKRKKLKNTKNVPKSVAFAHQQWMCCLQHDNSGKPCSVFLKIPPSSKCGIRQALNTYPYLDALSHCTSLDGISDVLTVPSATDSGIQYTKSDFVIIDCFQKGFARICDIVVLHHCVICIGQLFRTLHYDSHFNGYAVQQLEEIIAFKPEDLHIPWPVLLYKQNTLNASQFIICPISLPDVDELL